MSNYHQVTLAQASQYLYNYLQNQALFSVATGQSLGATIPISLFNNALEPENHGVAFWFCWLRNLDLQVPPFFMAFELNEFDPNASPPIIVRSNPLQRPEENCMFTYPSGTPPSLADTEAFLINHNPMPGSVATANISESDVLDLNANYIADFPDGAAHTEFELVDCCFFSSKDINTGNDDTGFLAFTQQSGIEFVRYYFCLVPDEEDVMHPKLILFGVDSEGNNLTSDGRVILEKSWP